MSFKIVKATIEHADDIGYVHVMSWRAAYKNIVPDDYLLSLSPVKRAERFRASLTTRPEVFYVAYFYNNAAGMLVYGKSLDDDADENTGEIGAIYLLPEYWNKGFGKQMMDHALADLKKQGFNKVTLWVLEDNISAIKFYDKCGFIFDDIKKEINIGKPLIEVRYSINI